MDTRTNTKNLPGRRQFLKRAAGAGLAVGVGQWLASCGFAGDEEPRGGTESRTHYFDLSNADPTHEYFLVAGARQHRLSRLTTEQVNAVRATAPGLLNVASQRITHTVTAELPADEIQMVYVKGVPAGAAPGPWSMPMMFFHVPSATTARVGQALVASGKGARSLKLAAGRALERVALAALGVGTAHAQDVGYCSGETYDAYKDYFDQAVAMVCHHPEICTFDAATLAYIQQNIVCHSSAILDLAVSLYHQGPATATATATGGWATLAPVIGADGQPEREANGEPRYYTQYSEETLAKMGAAIRAVLPIIKNDPVLGANITELDGEAENAGLAGKLWAVNNGSATVASGAALATALRAGDAEQWTLDDVSHASGYSVGDLSTSGRAVSFTVRNWFVRYLGLFIRYLDGNGQPIKLSDLPITIQPQFKGELSGPYDGFLSLVNQEFVVLGIPIKQDEQRFTVQVPDQAASFQILAGGLGTGSNRYPKTIGPGAVMTVVLDLAIPGVFLAMAASSGYKAFKTKVNAPASKQLMVAAAQLFVTAIADSILAGVYYNPSTFKNLASPLMSTLKSSGSWLYTALKESLAEGAAEGAAESFIPFGVGLALQAVMALGTAAEISQTSAEICNSPWTYVGEAKATHNLTVTINHDPDDVAGFPATATHYRLYAVCDGSSPYDSGDIAMPATTRTAPFTYTFANLPSGGKVNVSVHFFSASGWLAGAGATGPIANTVDTAAITIKEFLVPLSATTRYGHKQKIALDAGGRHVWQATAAAPLVQTNCDNVSGQLCELVGITLSEHFGALGYSWLASSAGVRNFANGASGQLYQFANLSFTENPQAGYMTPGGGFSTPARLAYDRSSTSSHSFYVDTSQGSSIVRRIAMTAVDVPPVADLPGSKKAVGRFNHACDAFLIHPTGKLVSINTALSKFEVLTPLGTPADDAQAPLAQAYAGPGTREGLLLGPACMAVTPGGTIVVLEQRNNRIQAFDTGANPTRFFRGKTSSFMPLRAASAGAMFLDLAVESLGYVYVLWTAGNVYTLDIYDPQGNWLTATTGVNAGKLTIDLFRNLYTLNFETLKPAGTITEPSISQWIPSTP
ncbi:MAG: twin-arginine translocation signal domain-containing protein [Ramlibacter sp.]